MKLTRKNTITILLFAVAAQSKIALADDPAYVWNGRNGHLHKTWCDLGAFGGVNYSAPTCREGCQRQYNDRLIQVNNNPNMRIDFSPLVVDETLQSCHFTQTYFYSDGTIMNGGDTYMGADTTTASCWPQLHGIVWAADDIFDGDGRWRQNAVCFRPNNRFPSKPKNSCEPSRGNPIYPLTGIKREVLDTGMKIGGVSLQFLYDTSGALWIDANPPFSGDIGALWWNSLNRKIISDAATTVMSRGDASVASLSPAYPVFKQMVDVRDGKNSLSERDSAFYYNGGSSVGYRDQEKLRFEGYDYFPPKSDFVLRTLQSISGSSIFANATTSGDPGSPGVGYITTLRDDFGRTLSITYDSIGCIKIITDNSGKYISFDISDDGNLTRIVWPDKKFRTFTYGAGGAPNWALTGIVDENENDRHGSVEFATFRYVTSTEHAEGVDSFQLTMVKPYSNHLFRKTYMLIHRASFGGTGISRSFSPELPDPPARRPFLSQ